MHQFFLLIFRDLTPSIWTIFSAERSMFEEKKKTNTKEVNVDN